MLALYANCDCLQSVTASCDCIGVDANPILTAVNDRGSLLGSISVSPACRDLRGLRPVHSRSHGCRQRHGRSRCNRFRLRQGCSRPCCRRQQQKWGWLPKSRWAATEWITSTAVAGGAGIAAIAWDSCNFWQPMGIQRHDRIDAMELLNCCRVLHNAVGSSASRSRAGSAANCKPAHAI